MVSPCPVIHPLSFSLTWVPKNLTLLPQWPPMIDDCSKQEAWRQSWRRIRFVQLCLSAKAKTSSSLTLSLCRSRGPGPESWRPPEHQLPKINLQPTQPQPRPHPQRNHPSWVRVPVKRPSTEMKFHQFFLKQNGTSTTSNNHRRRRTTLPKNRLFVIGMILTNFFVR